MTWRAGWIRKASLAAATALLLAACGGAGQDRTAARRGGAPTTRPHSTAPSTTTSTTGATSPDGPLPVPPSMAGTQWSSLPTDQPVAALTFDCGSNDGGLPAILSATGAAHVAATFFLTGRFAEAYPDMVREIVAGGYDVGNHTYDHRDLAKMSESEAADEVTHGARVVEGATGRHLAPLFRFPFGSWNLGLIRLVNGLGYGSFYWTVDTLGWEGTAHTATSPGGQTVGSVEDRVMRALTPGAIILMHCGSAPDGTTLDATALPSVIRTVRGRGYRFVSLHQFLSELGSEPPTGSSTKYFSS